MRFERVIALACLLLIGISSHQASCQDTSEWIRLVEEFEQDGAEELPARVRLEIASRRFERIDGGSGSVELVGVTHIGDARYYEALASALSGFDIVLYESVAPDGARGVGGDADEDRVAGTRMAMRFVGRVMEWHRMQVGTLPADLPELVEASAELDSRFPGWLREAIVDGWGEPLQMTVIKPVPGERGEASPQDEEPRVEWRLTSLGSDRVTGGEGHAADIPLDSVDLDVPRPSRGGMQAEIASALGLDFQLHALDYDRPGWVLADMTDSELRSGADELGVDTAPLLEGLSGGGLTARMGRMLLMLIRLADFISGNQVRDIVKVVLVESLANPAALDMAGAGMAGMDGLMELILHERNIVALECLDETLARSPGTSIALFYGAAHMPGLAEGLVERGWKAVDRPSWLPAIEVDLIASQVDPETMAMVRARFNGSMGIVPRPDRERPGDGDESP